MAFADVNDWAFRTKALSKPGGLGLGTLSDGGVAADEVASLVASPSSYGRDEDEDDCASATCVWIMAEV